MTTDGVGEGMRQLKDRLAAALAQVARLKENNERLVETLKEARTTIFGLKEEVDRLAQPPSGYGLFLSLHDDGTVDVFTGGRELRVAVSPSIEPSTLRPGQRVLLNDALNVVDALAFERTGEVVTFKEILDGGDRALVVSHADEERIVRLAGSLVGAPLRIGDGVLIEPRSAYAFERVIRSEVEELVLEEVPYLRFQDIGGLGRQIAEIRNAVELPFLHPELFRRYQLRAPKGVLLYGPPGCGKTLIAKAVANSLARQVANRSGADRHTSCLLNIKGPELLNKYVGETERRIRLVFQRARDKAIDGTPVIVFFDEMEAVFGTRGSGTSSDVGSGVIPQLLCELDGLESIGNVVVIGTSSREDLIDPAILRPGRLDVKIKIGRPDGDSAVDIFRKHLTAAVPIHEDDLAACGGDPDTARLHAIQDVVEFIYTKHPANRFVEVTYESGAKEDIHFSHFMSGAIIRNIVDRAKLLALLRTLGQAEAGVRAQDLRQAAADEIRSLDDLTNVASPDDWSRVSGARGERITYVRILRSAEHADSGKTLEIG